MSMSGCISTKRLITCTAIGFLVIILIDCYSQMQEENTFDNVELTPSIKEAIASIPESIPARPLKIQHWTSSLGTPVYFIYTPEPKMLDLELTFNVGSSRDADRYGLAKLTSSMLAEGSKHHSADSIARTLENLGTELFTVSGKDRTVISLRTLTEKTHLQPSVNLLTEIVSQPAFHQSDFERVRQKSLTDIQVMSKFPDHQAEQLMDQLIYKQHPYSNPINGLENTIKSIEPEDLQAFHQHYYVARNLTITLVGNLSKEQAEQISEHISLALPAGNMAEDLPEPAKLKSFHQKQITASSEQTYVFYACPGIPRSSPDYPAIYVANQILGGNHSILVEQLREKKGLVYSISSVISTLHYGGSFGIYLQTRGDQQAVAINTLQKLLSLFVSKGPTQQQLDDTRSMINGYFSLSTASNSELIRLLSNIAYHQLPVNEPELFLTAINHLTTEDVRNAFARIINPEYMILITAGGSDHESSSHRL